MQIVDGKALRVRVRSPERFTAVLPKSHYEGEVAPGIHEILVHWGFDEALVLKNMGVKGVPSPINKNYNWPGLYTPMQHQRETAEFCTMHKRCFVFDEQGLGKTCAAAWAADYLMSIGKVNRVLIICPVSIMQAAWQQDLFKTLMHRTVGIAHGTKSKRVETINSGAEFVIINYDGVGVVEDELKAAGFDLIIMDEGTYLKNAQAKRSKAILKLIGPETRVWLMTGTPAAQSPEDAYGLAKLVSPERVPKFFGSWRDMVMQKLTQFKYVPRAKAKELVHTALQPAIRHTKEECLDLPDIVYVDRHIPMTAQQEKYYKVLKEQMLAITAGEEISAVNAAAKMNKLLQVSCITYDTMTLTDSGWKPLGDVSTADLLWDGVEWVAHDGVVFNGERETVWLDGVRMTSDHNVLTDYGWYTAKQILRELEDDESSERFARAEVRIPDGYFSGGDDCRDRDTVRSLVVPLRVWQRGGTQESISTQQTQGTPEELRVPSRQRDAQDDAPATLPNLVRHASQMSRSARQGLQKLWGSGYYGVSVVDRLLRGILGGHAGRICPAPHAGSQRQQSWVQQAKLPVGDNSATVEQYEVQCFSGHPRGANDGIAGGKALWTKNCDSIGEVKPIRMAASTRTNGSSGGTQKVYDIKNAGPRNRFTVCGLNNKAILVHNCGSAYADADKDGDKATVEFDVKPRLDALDDIISESPHKVIVFVPFRHTITRLEQELAKRGHTTATICGDVSPSKRGTIFSSFQYEADPKVIIIQPQAAAHGVTLTAASTVVWFGPTTSMETYLQANARAHRKGQKNKVTVYQFHGSPVEQQLYKALSIRGAAQVDLLALYKQELST